MYIKGKKNKEVEVILGKEIDIVSLKNDTVVGFKSRLKEIRDSRKNFYITQKNRLKKVNKCPICRWLVKNQAAIFSVYGAQYIQCQKCSHVFVEWIPDKTKIEKFYAQSEGYQRTYADSKTAQKRLHEIALPKALWLKRYFEKLYGRSPKKILDVGAGSGHFVKACKDLGLEADGLEFSRSGREFCKEIFGFELINKDFIKYAKDFKDYDVVTFWGVIEHVPNPTGMLAAASKIIAKQGLVVAEVPRWGSLSTVIQGVFPESIIRHLDPLGHINCFTDESLFKAFSLNKLDISAVWYFGMDAYELVIQLANYLKEDTIIKGLKSLIPIFQKNVDLNLLSDEMVVAAVPRK